MTCFLKLSVLYLSVRVFWDESVISCFELGVLYLVGTGILG